MNMDSTFSIPPQVMARTVGNETVILNMESGTYFGLDPVGARIWQLIEAGKALAEICNVMLEEFEVKRDKLERDTLALASELVQNKIIAIR